MVSLVEMMEVLSKVDSEVEELWPTPVAPELKPVVKLLADEIGDNLILAEGALAWVRLKKQEILLATLNTIYTPEQLEALRKKMEETQ